MSPVRVAICYPTDPFGSPSGGIDTFIRGQLAFRPDTVEFLVIGATRDPQSRPIGQWHTGSLNGRRAEFFPVCAVPAGSQRGVVPATVKYLSGLARWRRQAAKCDVLEFHRIEPVLAFRTDRRPKTAILHQNMRDLQNKGSDILWRRAPRVYFRMEEALVPCLATVFCVRRDAVDDYRQRFATVSTRFTFQPTWADPTMFHPVDDPERYRLRQEITRQLGWPQDAVILTTVGRLDRQKDPLLLAESFVHLIDAWPQARLAFIGDGVLREQLGQFIEQNRLSDRVRMIGALDIEGVSKWLRAADLFALSSAYEGMPMVVIEALASGVPVVATDVGELRRLVRDGTNGAVAGQRNPAAFAEAISTCLGKREEMRGVPCTSAAAAYQPETVLSNIFQNYLHLCGR